MTVTTEPLRRRVHYGPGSVARVPEVIDRLRGRRVLLVTGKRSFEASGADRILPELQSRARVHHWSDFQPNTDAEDLAAGLKIVDEVSPDVIVAIGGGSAMDMAKLLCAYRGTRGATLIRERIREGRTIVARDMQLVLVPTTSGSGAEATRFAVVYIGDRKYSIAGPAMLPDTVVLDPALTLSGSPYQRATSAIDAVAQAIESWWAVSATDRSRRFARHSLRLLLPNIQAFVIDEDERAARAMAIGSHLAGRAIDVSKTTAAHALSYGFTKGFGISHGHAVALTLGVFIERHADLDPAELQDGVAPHNLRAIMAEILARLDAADGKEARQRFTELVRRVGLEPSLTVLGIADPEQRRSLARDVNADRLGNNPWAVHDRQLEDLLLELP